ncbi:MAG TPA: glutathione S-transferase N-terminal domain-containing protein [Stellaceae bacterium]|nr:glutathione S-transferase N-terminal domain-containing protein [Stellaceae bacterium]
MKLRFSPTSPFVRKVCVVAFETGLEQRLERMPTAVAPTKRNDEVARENPLVKIPALTTDDGLVIYDSCVICEYLDTLHQGPKLFPAAGLARWIALRQQALGDGVLDAAILGRYEMLRPKEFQWQDWIDAQLRKVRGALSALEMECEAGTLAPVAAGAAPTIGQITIGCALGYLDFRYASEAWRERHKRLDAWYQDFAQRPAMRQSEPKDPA